jgi:DNA-binding NtrC family response regulator
MADLPVLIVTDGAPTAAALRELVSAEGRTPWVATPGEALDLAAQGASDLALVDATGGTWLLRRLKSARQGLDLLAVVPGGDDARAAEAIRAGAGDCICLPVERVVARAALRRVLARQALAARLAQTTAERDALAAELQGWRHPRGQLKAAVAEVERRMVTDALVRGGGNRSAAAAELGIYRRLLYAKMREHGLETTPGTRVRARLEGGRQEGPEEGRGEEHQEGREEEGHEGPDRGPVVS